MPTFQVTAPDGRSFAVEGDSPPTEKDLDEIFTATAGSAQQAPLKGLGQGLLTGVGNALKSIATTREAMSRYDVARLMAQADTGATPTAAQPAAQEALTKLQSPGEILRAASGREGFQTGQALTDIAKEDYPISEREGRGVLTKAGEMAGQVGPLLLTGPAAPVAIGLESAGEHITSDYDEAKRQGKSDDEAADIAVNRAALSGTLQAGVFAVLPKPLRSAAEKFLVNKLGTTGFRRWLTGRVAAAGEGAALGTSSAGAENLLSGRPVTEGMGPAALGLAGANVLLPWLRERTPNAIQRTRKPFLPNVQSQPAEGAGQVPAQGGSTPTGERGGKTPTVPAQAVGKPASRKWQVTVQAPEQMGERTIPGYVQIDDITGGQNHWSLGPDKLREQGVDTPDFSSLPSGKYDWDEAVKLLRETAAQRGGRVDILTTEDDYLAAERQAIAEAEKQGSPIKLVDQFTDEDPNHPFAGQFMRATPKGIELKKSAFRQWLQDTPPERRQEAIKQRIAEEHIHRQVTPGDALAYWNSLTALEQAAELRQYTGYWSRGKLKAERGAEFSDSQLGHEALRRRLQRLESGTTSEIAEAALKERWTLRSLDVLEDAVRGLRERLGTKASREGISALDRASQNLAAARTAMGDTPAAYDKRRKQKKEGSEQARLPLPEAQKGESRPAATELGARPFTALDLDKAGYAHLENETERIRQNYEDNPGARPKPLSFDDYKTELQNKFGDLKPGQLYESFSKNLYNRLFNASGKTLEALQRSLGVKLTGRIPDPPQRKPGLLQTEGATPAARAQMKAEAQGAASRQRYRIGAISIIARKLLGEAEAHSEAKPTRTNVSPEDLRLSGPTKEPAMWDVSREDLNNPQVLAQRLVQDARRSNRDPLSLTKRLTALLDRQTGKVFLVSTYAHGRSGAMLLDPSISTVKAHRPLEQILNRYRPLASLLLDEPVRNFRQSFDSLGDFENRIATDARRSVQRTFEPPLAEGEEEQPGALESGGPITDAEAAAILDHIYEESGTFDSPDDVKASLAALKEDTKYQVLSGYRKLARDLQAKNPDLSDAAVINQLAQNIYENHASAKGEAAFETFIRRTMAQGGAENRPAAIAQPEAAAAQTGKELTMPLERRPPTDVRPENVPPGTIPEKKPAPPVPEGTPKGSVYEPEAMQVRESAPKGRPLLPEVSREGPETVEGKEGHGSSGTSLPGVSGKAEVPPAAFNKQAKAIFDEVMDQVGSEYETAMATAKGAPARDLISRGVDDAENLTNNFARQREDAIRLVTAKKPKFGAIGRAISLIRGDEEVLRAANALVQAQAVSPDGSINNNRRGMVTTYKRMVRTGIRTAQDMVRSGQPPPSIASIQGLTTARIRRIGRAWERAGKQMLAELEYAYTHWFDPQLQETARRVKLELDGQYLREIDSGVDIAHDPNYLPGRYDPELWLNNSVVFPSRSKVWGEHWRASKKFPTYYHAIENGPYIPVTRDSASLVGHRVRQGTRQIMRRAWEEGLQRMVAPDGRPVAIEPAMTSVGWQSPDKTYDAVGKGLAKPLLIHPDFSRLVKQLVSESPLETFAPTRAAIHASQALKHMLLVGDFFHLGRVVYYATSILGKGAGYQGGWSVLDIAEKDLKLAVSRGVITAEDAEWGQGRVRFGNETITRRQLAARLMGGERGQPGGLNVGRIQDALYKDLITQLTPSAGPMRVAVKRLLDPTIGGYNRFLFDKLTRGLMLETAVKEFERQSAKLPNADPYALMRDIARDTNNYYGNIGKQGWLKAKWAQDLARMLFLAPQWVEGLIKKEAIGYSRLTGLSKISGSREGLSALGTTGKGIGQGLLALFVMTQAINLFSRGKTTFQNEEHGHKLDAYIPLGKGFWLSPFSVFNELTHDLWRFLNTKPTFADAATTIAGNKLSPLTRAAIIAYTGRSATGVQYTTTLGRAKGVAGALAPIPITFGRDLQALGHLAAPNTIPASPPGALGRQVFATMGVKVEPKESPRAEMFDLAKRWVKETGRQKESGWQEIQTDEASYTKLRSAIGRGDEGEAKKIYDELKQSRKPNEIRKAMRPFTVALIPGTDAYERHYKPFSGSRKNEAAFVRSLTPAQKETYRQARKDQDEMWQQFKALQQKWEP